MPGFPFKYPVFLLFGIFALFFKLVVLPKQDMMDALLSGTHEGLLP